MAPADLARHAFIVLVIGIIAVFGLKFYNKSKAKKAVIVELQQLTSDTAMFEQFNSQEATATLLKAVHKLHKAHQRYEIAPADAIDRAFRIQEEGVLEATDTSRRRTDPREELVRQCLLRNVENATRLGFFEDSLSTDMLARGETPMIATGPGAGQAVEIGYIIDPTAFPGVEKIIPNLVLRPPTKTDNPPDDFQIALAKRLASQLEDSGIIERDTATRILAHYDALAKALHEPPAADPPEPAPAADPLGIPE